MGDPFIHVSGNDYFANTWDPSRPLPEDQLRVDGMRPKFNLSGGFLLGLERLR